MSIRSASVQSHHSQPRHRDPRPSHATILSSDATRDFPLSLTRGPLKDTLPPVVDGPLPRPLFWSNSFGWILSGYIIISLAFFSVSLYHGYCTSLSPSLQTSTTLQTPSPTVSRIDVLSPATRLAKLVSLYLPPTHFGPFAYRPLVDPHPHEVTACLWASESNLDWVPSWTNDWLGPTSLVVVTRLPPASSGAQDHPALRRLLRHPMLNASRLAMHVLHLDPTTPEAPNIFLNLARLFASTRNLLLVPGTPKPPPSSSIASLSITHLREPVIVRGVAPGLGTPTPADKRYPALSPILIPRDHTLWCVERFTFLPAPTVPRAADWDACLWQVQLETFGAATIGGPTVPEWRWDAEAELPEPALRSISLSVGHSVSRGDVHTRNKAARNTQRGMAQWEEWSYWGASWTQECGEDALVT